MPDYTVTFTLEETYLVHADSTNEAIEKAGAMMDASPAPAQVIDIRTDPEDTRPATHIYTILVPGSFTIDVDATSPAEALEESYHCDYQFDWDTWHENDGERSIWSVDGEEYIEEEN